MCKLYNGNLRASSDCTVLEQALKTDFFSIELLERFGGCSFINGEYIYNYSEANDNKLIIYDNNRIRLILPPEATNERVELIKSNLRVLNIKDIKTYDFIGYWVNKNGDVMKEVNSCIEFNSKLNDLRLDYFIKVMNDIKYEYDQESTAFMVEDALILI